MPRINVAFNLLSVVLIGVWVAGSVPCAWAAGESPGDPGMPHLRKQGAATQLIVDGKPMLLLAGELHNSSASSLAYMQDVWPRLAALHLNTVLATASWELVEPEEGKFDFTLIDALVDSARRNDLHLVFLWFGTWKNTWSSYTPPWVKTDLERFPLAQRPTCQNSERTNSISAFSENACKSDARALAAFMHHLKEIDASRHTVVMIQVENETGLLGFSRDHCQAAEAAFAGPVPAELMDYLKAHRSKLLPELDNLWKANGNKETGTWQEVFGKGTSPAEIYCKPDASDEVFMAWHVGRYVDRVAEAGKKEYALPMFANAWLKGEPDMPPGRYPSGGPVSRMFDVWHAAAPSIDVLAPDIYLPDFTDICASFTRGGNPLLIPERAPGEESAVEAFTAFGTFDAICFSPFGIDGVTANPPLAKSYDLLRQLMPVLVEHQGKAEALAIAQNKDEETREMELGGYKLHVKFNRRDRKAAGIVIATGPDQFIVAGWGFGLEFHAEPGKASHVEFLVHEEGKFDNGKWAPGRRMNGDEYNIKFTDEPSIRRVTLYSYK